MPNAKGSRHTILIADDMAMNRALLQDIIEDEYDTLEAKDGKEAVEVLAAHEGEVSLVLLDIMMPVMNGFDVLEAMRASRRMRDIPVIMISAEEESKVASRAFDLGVSDFIRRPFDVNVVRHRVRNVLSLAMRERRLFEAVAEQTYQRAKNTDLMISILSHIVEFRNGESGMHVLNVAALTRLVLETLVAEGAIDMSAEGISLATTASSLHDIGKISIPGDVLNKPGRLTNEEFEMMKAHTTIGDQMLAELPFGSDVPLIAMARRIVRHHHERWDGRGYPDGLAGDAIPMEAQAVALADVYDALTSERVYKAAIPHEKAVEMILNGECGAFNPLLLDVLKRHSSEIAKVKGEGAKAEHEREVEDVIRAVSGTAAQADSNAVMERFEYERVKHRFFAAMSHEIQYEFTEEPPTLIFHDFERDRFGIGEVTLDPADDDAAMALFGQAPMRAIARDLRDTTPEAPTVVRDVLLEVPRDGAHGKRRWMRVSAMALWGDDGAYEGSIGKIADVDDERRQEEELRRLASHDALTGIYNRGALTSMAVAELASEPGQEFALVLVDVDDFKLVNDERGHLEGDRCLKALAAHLEDVTRHGDMVGRIGGDEFLVVARIKDDDAKALLERLSHTMGADVSVSVGAATTTAGTRDYETLFSRADTALYSIKRQGKGRWALWEPSMGETPEASSVGPIDEEEA